ncbi:F-box domain [Macleaya cordata]|uniref:F-box domain n=1 Tax=Macleaya cordata TaxID=56857 RepID=A0A200QLQ2_MACCD|nr:F-box domain [Macleaya cordata]
MSSLPDELVVNVLSRLPVKSISLFRCVSKSWCNLFSDPAFINTHLNHAIERNNFRIILKRCYLYSINFGASSKSSSPSSCDDDDDEEEEEEAVEIDFPFKSGRFKVDILSSYNGLVCISPDKDKFDVICIWNPSTKEYKKLSTPLPVIKFPFLPRGLRDVGYGFGYDRKIEDYKLVRILHIYGSGSEVEVYTLGSNSKKSIGHIPYELDFPSQTGVFVNATLHWIATPATYFGHRGSPVIISFDIVDQRFQEVPQPEEPLDYDNNEFYVRTVGVLRGCLCLLGCLNMVCVDVWVMKDYGARDSWTKLFTINAQQTVIKHFNSLTLVQSFKSGEVLLQKDCNTLVLYDPKRERARFIKIRGFHQKCFKIETYIESLVSLNSGTYLGQEKIDEEAMVDISHYKKLKLK